VNNLPTFVDQANILDKSFSFYLNLDTEKSYMVIPGYDEDMLAASDFTYHKVAEEKYYSLKFDTM